MPTPQVQNDPIYLLPFLYINGLSVTLDGTTPNTKLNISSGQCRDSNDIMDIALGSSNPNIQGNTVSAPLILDATTNGANGLDTGSFAASKLYAVYVIGDSRYYQPVASLLSLSLTSPLMPFGYDSYRLIGYAVTDGSTHFLPAYIAGNNNYRQFLFDAPQATAITAGNATSYTVIDLSALVPNVDNTPVWIASILTPGAAGRQLFLQPAGATGNAVLITGQVTSVAVTSNSKLLAKRSSSLPKISYKVTNSGDAAAINVAGFDFYI
jgi:hypothetical protein